MNVVVIKWLTYIFQYGCFDDVTVEAGPPTVQPKTGPVLTGAQTPVPEVPDLQGQFWTCAVHLAEPRHLATPLRHQQLAVERNFEVRQLEHGRQEH